mmetsp:Transcript_42751/g.91135  ORF Transcript_42751/g.91135 Transcript_42751/m.91135 type:complete len:204 (+) Transcript_42751:483-1094(+)
MLLHIGLEVEELENNHGIGDLLWIRVWRLGQVVAVVDGEQGGHINLASGDLFFHRPYKRLGHLPALLASLALEQLGRVKVSTDFFVRYELEHAMSALLVESSVKVISEYILRLLFHDPVAILRSIVQGEEHAPDTLAGCEASPISHRQCARRHNDDICHIAHVGSGNLVAISNPLFVRETQDLVPLVQSLLDDSTSTLPPCIC